MPIWSTRSPLETKTSKSPSRAARACSARFAAALAEVGTAEACLVLTRNCDAEIAEFSLDRVLERFGDAPAIREALLARNDLAPSTRLTMVTRISATLVDFVAARRWLDADHAQRIGREACEKATVTLAADTPATQMRSLVRHLRAGGALTAGLILRALLSGNVRSIRRGIGRADRNAGRARLEPRVRRRQWRAARAVQSGESAAFHYPAFKEAIEAMREGGFMIEPGSAARLKRRMIERVLTRCENEDIGDLAPLLTLLRRFATEAAREEARMFCDGLVAEYFPEDEQYQAA
jgi:Uncharacterised protein conserved in bacteria (DUF2336)